MVHLATKGELRTTACILNIRAIVIETARVGARAAVSMTTRRDFPVWDFWDDIFGTLTALLWPALAMGCPINGRSY